MSSERWTKDHRPLSSDLFLDTSIHCAQLKGPLFRNRISDLLRQFRWTSTSTYTLLEFGNVVLSTAEYFLRKLDELGTLEATSDFIGNVLPHNLHPKKVTWAFNLLRVYGRNEAECTERARLSLRRLMKTGVSFIEQQRDRPLADGTACYWARRGVQKSRDGSLVWQAPICKRSKKRCRLDDFFVDNRDVFAGIKQAIDRLEPEDRTKQLNEFSEVIGKALTDPAILLDYRTGCRRLADAIIAVDSIGYRSFFTQNVSESALLTNVLKQVLYYLPASPKDGVLIQLPVIDNESTTSGSASPTEG